ncbi:MAG TPA: hypothetical protein VE993_02340 [Stellaceae bacterium]|nr:hypothetical protein [Stellaceae bacterium]
MQYRIELSTTRRGAARIYLPGRTFELETRRLSEAEWEVWVSDPAAARSGTVAVRAASANDAVWHVARAAVRAIAELTGRPLEDGAAESR